MNSHSVLRQAMLAATAGGLVFSFAASAGEDKFQKFDTNKDGTISSAEHAAGAREMFAKMDADGDGNVTVAEMNASHEHAKPDESGGPKMTSADKIKTIDSDRDGAITATEHEAGSREMFEKMDADGDGKLTAAEMQAGHEKMMGEEPPR